MVLVDTSVWVSHLRTSDTHLKSILQDGEVVCHPFIIGELACGNIKNRNEIISLLQALPTVKIADHDEILRFIDVHQLMGIGLGLIDVHLLASALLSNVTLWTADKHLKAASTKLNINY
ncbi:MAG: PIN domain-containing protein [Chloroflexi bacterium]|jgi:predicted nucleic acid-binding protein|nr:PIN domain-containing protein [Chloroflexota bacterium]